MKTASLLLASLLTTGILLAQEATPASTPLTAKQEGVKYIKLLGGTLKGKLQKEMKADKTALGAVAFCAKEAEALTKEVNAKLPTYATVRRTALKLRNPQANGADALDIEVMKGYEESIANKSFSPKDIRVVEHEGVTRIYKPLLAKPVCLLCHGSKISPAIQAEITKHYPQDKAVDFAENSLRGVIVAEIAKH